MTLLAEVLNIEELLLSSFLFVDDTLLDNALLLKKSALKFLSFALNLFLFLSQ